MELKDIKVGMKVYIKPNVNLKLIDGDYILHREAAYGIVRVLSGNAPLTVSCEWFTSDNYRVIDWWVHHDALIPDIQTKQDKFNHHKKRVEERHLKKVEGV